MQKFTPQEYLKIDIANSFGLDKKSWAERIVWFDENESKLSELVYKAEEPAMYFAGVQAWEAVKRSEPIGYPISLDATSSGLQILACLTGDIYAAQLCNVVNTGQREDAYTSVYKHMLEVSEGNGTVERKDCKRAIMTSLYGSKAVPKEVFGEGVMFSIFIDTMKTLAPAAWELNEAFLQIWDPTALINSWVLPDNFHVHVKVITNVLEPVEILGSTFTTQRKMNAPVQEGRSLGANTIHSIDGMIVREMTRRCDYNVEQICKVRDILMTLQERDPDATSKNTDMLRILWNHYKQSGYLSARVLDYIDEVSVFEIDDRQAVLSLIASLPKKPFKLMTIHDCFRCLPNYGNDLREQYNLQLTLIAKSNLLQFLLGQILKRPLQLDKLYPDMWKHIMDADYALS